jgi:hypothetical protein
MSQQMTDSIRPTTAAMKRRRAALTATVVVAAVVASCGQPEGVTTKSDNLFSNPASVWTAKPGVTLPITIPVCFENYGISRFDSSTAQFRAWLQDQVSSTWQRYARVNFTGWGACPVPAQPVVPGTKGVPGVHIFLDPPTQCPPPNDTHCGKWCGGTGTDAGNTGSGSDGAQGYLETDGFIATTAGTPQAGVRMNSLLDHSFCSRNPGMATGEDATRNLAHEFGHVLGLWHEEQRPTADVPNPCTTAGNRQTGTRWGGYDPMSWMSYCNPDKWQHLSPTDIMGIQRIYGRRIPGEIVSRSGYCLSGHQNDTSAFLWNCDEPGEDQIWRRGNGGGESGLQNLFRQYGSTHRCLRASSTTDGTLLSSPVCNGLSRTDWSFENIEVRGAGGQCLHHNGSGLQLNLVPCSSEDVPSVSSTRQKWNIGTDGSIRLASNTLRCVTAMGSADTSAVNLQSCPATTPPSNQRFAFQDNGNIVILSSGKCLDMLGQLPSQFADGQGWPSGQPVQVYTCLSGADNLNQRWNFSGQLRLTSATTKCADRPSTNDSPGVAPQIFGCWVDPDDPFPNEGPQTSAHASQQWDYYFKGP